MDYTVKDLEDKLKISRYKVMRLAKQEKWQVVKKVENGTTKNYYLAADVDKYIGVPAVQEESQRTRTVAKREVTAVDELPEWNQKVAWARYTLCLYLQQAYDESVENKGIVIERFVNEAFKEHPKEMEVLKKISVSTLHRWYGAFIKDTSNPLLLASSHGANKGIRKISSEIIEDIKSLYFNKNKPKMTFVYERLVMKYGKEVISYPTLRNFIKYDLTSIEKDRARMGKKEFHDAHDIYIERDYTTLRVNELWVSDGHDLEMSCYHPTRRNVKGERVITKPKLIVWQDMRSRMLVGWTLSWGETAESIAIALKNGIEKYGKPEKVYTDNGKAYKGKILKGTRDAYDGLDGLYAALGIKAIHAIVRNAQAKPIERWFVDFKESFAKSSLTYQGGNILERKEELKDILRDKILRNKILEFNELEAMIEEWIEYKNHAYYAVRRMMKKKGHRGHGMDNMTPLEVFNKLLPLEDREMLTDDKLRLLFLYEENRIVQQNGVTFLENTYEHEKLFFHLKEQVKIKYDPHDLSYILVYLKTGEFLCKAERFNRASFNDIDGYKAIRNRAKKIRSLESNIIKLREEEREQQGIIELANERVKELETKKIESVKFKHQKSIKIADGIEIMIDEEE